jgi:DNA invertase Pin-like site-specific DNA recombinase
MANVIAYTRVSLDQQAQHGSSLSAQSEAIARWADIHGHALAEVFTDAGVSGAKAQRPGLSAALAACQRGDILCVYSLSRLGRSVKNLLELSELLSKRGIDLASVTESIDTSSPAGRMVFSMMAVMAEFERAVLIERVTSSMRHKKRKGELVGAVPFGKKLGADGKKLLVDEDEQKIIEKARILRADGLSLRAVAAELERVGMLARNGKPFAAAQIARFFVQSDLR